MRLFLMTLALVLGFSSVMNAATWTNETNGSTLEHFQSSSETNLRLKRDPESQQDGMSWYNLRTNQHRILQFQARFL